MGPDDLKFLKSAKNDNVGLAGTIMLRGEWDPQTREAERFLAIYSPMFSKYTRAGFLLVGLDLFKKILQSYFLSFIGTPPERSGVPPIDRVYERASYDKTDAILQLEVFTASDRPNRIANAGDSSSPAVQQSTFPG